MNIDNTIKNLKKRGFEVSFFETGKDAASYITSKISGKTIGIGGSKTIEELDLFESLSKNNDVYWHWKQKPVDEIRRKATNAQVYICSANALAETGEIVNIDGSGNRLAASIYDKEKVIFVVGVNKIEDDLDKAIWRARNIASPLNARRFDTDTPCVKSKDMKCFDCSSPQRICNALLVIMGRMMSVDECEVIIIDEKLGY